MWTVLTWESMRSEAGDCSTSEGRAGVVPPWLPCLWPRVSSRSNATPSWRSPAVPSCSWRPRWTRGRWAGPRPCDCRRLVGSPSLPDRGRPRHDPPRTSCRAPVAACTPWSCPSAPPWEPRWAPVWGTCRPAPSRPPRRWFPAEEDCGPDWSAGCWCSGAGRAAAPPPRCRWSAWSGTRTPSRDRSQLRCNESVVTDDN